VAHLLGDDIGQLGLADATHPTHAADARHSPTRRGTPQRPDDLPDLVGAAHKILARRANLVQHRSRAG
jgi:hypothetical protein